MKNKRFFARILSLVLVFGLILCGCDNLTNPVNGTHETASRASPVDPAFWFGEIHEELISSSLLRLWIFCV
jgi:hypothetical protein